MGIFFPLFGRKYNDFIFIGTPPPPGIEGCIFLVTAPVVKAKEAVFLFDDRRGGAF